MQNMWNSYRALPASASGCCLRAGPAAAGAIVSAGATSLVGLLTWRWHRSQAGAADAMSPSRESAPGSTEWRGPLSRHSVAARYRATAGHPPSSAWRVHRGRHLPGIPLSTSWVRLIQTCR